MSILVTGGFGFIGSNFVLRHQQKSDEPIVILDKMTYAANPNNLKDADKSRLAVYRGDINNEELVANILSAHEPRAIINFAAESHVDRSISGAAPFVQTNIVGLANLLEMARQYSAYRTAKKLGFRFLQVGTDEVYGSLTATAPSSKEGDSYAPRSPYSASKAAGDHLCMSYFTTYGLPVIVTNSGNNYGPRQHPEKFIPTAILALLQGRKIPVYGNGQNVREWIHVDDHCDALEVVLERGVAGQQYNIGSPFHSTNLELALDIVSKMNMGKQGENGDNLEFVNDRPGHDFRYSLDCSKIQKELGWQWSTTLEHGLQKTVEWYRNEYK